MLLPSAAPNRAVGRCAALLTLATSANALSEEYTRANTDLLFANFKQQHGRVYANAAEEELRSKIFAANMIDAARLEQMNPQATFGASKFADRSQWCEPRVITFAHFLILRTSQPGDVSRCYC